MKFSLNEIYYKNIREMEELTISLQNGNRPSHISLIQMPNGLGKTTTMELIRYCLDKKSESLSAAKIESFKPPGSNVQYGEFRIKITIDNKIKYVTLKLDYNEHSVELFTSSTESGGLNRYLDLGPEMDPWLNSSFTKLFVFDGELAGNLLKAENTSAEDAIKALYHLDNLQSLYFDNGVIDKLVTYKLWNEKVHTNQGIKNNMSRLETARLTRTSLNTEIERIKGLINKDNGLKNEYNANLESYRAKDQESYKEYYEVEGKIKELDIKIKHDTEELLRQIRVPINISDSISDSLSTLYTQMGKLKLPKTQSQEFFIELSEENECVCGREITKKEKQVIIEKSKDYLTENNIGVINEIKTSLKNLTVKDDLLSKIEEIKKDNIEHRRKSRDLTTLDGKTQYRNEIENLNKKIIDLNIEMNKLTENLNLLTEDRKEYQKMYNLKWDVNIHLCNEYIDKLTEEIAKSTGNIEFKNKANALKDILGLIADKSMMMLKDDILNETNKKISKILKSNDIRIEKIDKYLTIYDRKGASEGQKLSIAYAFLSTLFSQSPHKFPFIVDTPAAPLDLEKRREVAAILPDLFEQLIVFITSGERDNFADKFYDNKDCQFLTISRGVDDNIVLRNDCDFFKSFQSEAE